MKSYPIQKNDSTLRLVITFFLLAFLHFSYAQSNIVKPAPDRKTGEGEGPFERLIIRGATVIDGTGAPPRGPMDIVIEGNKIVSVTSVGTPQVPIDNNTRPKGATKEIDAHGAYVLPGFINLHAHVGGPVKAPEAEYAYKLWMGHGITTIRGVPAGNVNWTQNEKKRSAENKIVAPRIIAFQTLGSGEDWEGGPIHTPEQAKAWVRWAAGKGVDGIKIFDLDPTVLQAALDETYEHKMGSVAHITQNMVGRVNALDAAQMGLRNLTHFYGLFEALYKAEDIQHWPPSFNYSNEQDRFSQVAYQWDKIHPRGSQQWQALIDKFLSYNFIIDPTMTAYLAGRDVMRERNADWHAIYTLPTLWDFYKPSRINHGSYFYNWTAWDEVAWKNFYRVWMSFLNDYKNAGGRVTVSDDASFIYNLYGFGYIEEMELLQEAGFHPLEVIRGATLHAAQAIHEPKEKALEFGIIRPGLLADLVIVEENPIENLKVLYGTGFLKLNDETGEMERIGGVKYTIKDGIIYDAKQLLRDVADMVEKQRKERE
ncbi:MAG: amidohydrolase [Saprospiraceae bacterium]